MKPQSTTPTDETDILIIGGGPAGAAASLVLARHGRSVLLLEKSRFPRYHIGESMVPYLTQLLSLLGLREQVEELGFVPKHGVEVFDEEGTLRRAPFEMLASGQAPLAYQLDRERFDALVLDRAERAGARIQHEAVVTALLWEQERLVGVSYQQGGEQRTVRARFVIDASGRAGLVSRHLQSRKMNPRLQNVAIFQMFKDLVPENNPSIEGDLVLGSHKDGWVWAIPLAGEDPRASGYLSVGAVMPRTHLQGREAQAIFNDHCSRLGRIQQRIQGATPMFERVKVEADFCYHSERLAGPGYFIVGDAACFVDPLFSGGLFLAMLGGVKAAEAILDVFTGETEAQAVRSFECLCKTGYDTYFRMIYAFYEEIQGHMPALFDFFPCAFPLVLQTFSGDFWGPPDQPMLAFLRSERQWDTFTEPFDYVHDCPIYPDHFHRAEDFPPGAC